jgi:hypothetical protein
MMLPNNERAPGSVRSKQECSIFVMLSLEYDLAARPG